VIRKVEFQESREIVDLKQLEGASIKHHTIVTALTI
jgi:hypothetical protein